MADTSNEQATIVYGYIRDRVAEPRGEFGRQRRLANYRVLMDLPAPSAANLIHRGMFAIPEPGDPGWSIQVLPFGDCRGGLEYHWDAWIEQFEELLRQLYWHRVTVHLETQALGTHTFRWEARGEGDAPGEAGIQQDVRYLWARAGTLL